MALTTPPFVIEHGQEQTWEYKRLVASGTTASIDRGTFASEHSTASNGNVAILSTSQPTVSTARIAGLAKNASTETSSAAGAVELFYPAPGLIYRGNAKGSTDMNTQAKVDALVGVRTTLNLTSTTWTVNTTSPTDVATAGILIVGGNPNTNECYFALMTTVTIGAGTANTF